MQTVNTQRQNNKEREARCAIVAPNKLFSLPGFFLLLGKDKSENSQDIPRLTFIEEVERPTSEELFAELIKKEEKFRFHTIYFEKYPTGIGNIPPDFILGLVKYLRKKAPWLRIIPAIYSADVTQGVDLLNQWSEKIDIPEESILRRQLKNIKRDSCDDPSHYTFTALRFLLAGFKHDKSFSERSVEKKRAKALKEESRKKLTGADRAAWSELDEIREELDQEEDW